MTNLHLRSSMTFHIILIFIFKKQKSRELTWTSEALSSFTATKAALADASLLIHPASDAPTSIMSDASDVAVGAVLQQFLHGRWCPIAYFSKPLKPAEN